jgi:hypothetical protein
MKLTGHTTARAATLAALTAAAAGLAACATMPPAAPFVPDANPDRAAVTIFRERQFENSAFETQVRINGQSVGALRSGAALVANAAPGELKIAIQSEYDFRELVLPLHAEPGRDYYVDVTPRPVYLAQFGPGVYALPKDKAGAAACNGKWCIIRLTADEAKAKMAAPAG